MTDGLPSGPRGRHRGVSRHRAPSALLAPARRPWVLGTAVLVVLGVVLLVVRPWTPELAPVSYPGPAGSWTKVFDDEFGGPALDTSVWQPHRSAPVVAGAVPFNADIEDAWFDPADATVAHGHLALTVHVQRRTLAGHSYGHSSGMVQSTRALTVHPVEYLEARIRIPDCSGCWPAFWLEPFDRWPPEVDIAEYLESGSVSRPTFNYIDARQRKSGPVPYGDSGVDYRDAFHTYGLLWDGRRAVPYLDGRPQDAVSVTRGMTRLPMMVLLNLSVRGGYSPPEGAQMLVDWVRVWQPAPTARSASS